MTAMVCFEQEIERMDEVERRNETLQQQIADALQEDDSKKIEIKTSEEFIEFLRSL